MRKARILFVPLVLCSLSLNSCITTALLVGVHEGVVLERQMNKQRGMTTAKFLEAARREDSLRVFSADTTINTKLIPTAEDYHFHSGDSLILVKDSNR